MARASLSGAVSSSSSVVLPPIGQCVTAAEISGVTNAAYVSGRATFHPISLRAATYDALLVNVAVAEVGGTTTLKLGVYADDGTGGAPKPGAAGLLSSVTVSLAGVSAGANVVGVLASPLALPGGRYWLATYYGATVAPTTPAQSPALALAAWSLPFAPTVSPGSRFRGRSRTGLTDLPIDSVVPPVSAANEVVIVGIRRSA